MRPRQIHTQRERIGPLHTKTLMPKYTGSLGESVELAIFQKRMATVLKHMRKNRIFKANDLAKRVGISQTHMTGIMRGEANISLNLLHAFCRELDCRTVDLIGNTADPSVNMPENRHVQKTIGRGSN